VVRRTTPTRRASAGLFLSLVLAAVVSAQTAQPSSASEAASPEDAEQPIEGVVEDEWIVGFEELPDGVEIGDTYRGARVLNVLGPEKPSALFDTSDAPDFVDTLDGDPNVRYADQNRFVVVPDDEMHAPGPLEMGDASQTNAVSAQTGDGNPDSDSGSEGGGAAGIDPGDPCFNGCGAISQYGPQLIGADEAWRTTLGTTDAAVCVIDSGVRATHEDIRGVTWRDFVSARADPFDDSGHGTHVTGIATARTGNGKGIAGIAQVRLYVANIFRLVGGVWTFTSADLESAIHWCDAGSNPRMVINMSLQGWFANPTPDNVSLAIEAAYSHGRLLVAAAGNYGPCSACIAWPAKHPDVIAVTNVDETKTFHSSGPSTCPGSSKDSRYAEFAAPGVAIWSTSRAGDTWYEPRCGTSMAAPHVAGALALAWSYPDNHGLTNTQLWQRARDTAEDLGPEGYEGSYGHGLVDAKCLVKQTPYPIRNPDAEAGPGIGEITVTWTKPVKSCDSTITGYRIYRAPDGGEYSQIAEVGAGIRSYRDTGHSNGTKYIYRVRAKNGHGTSYYTKSVSATTFAKPSVPRNVSARPGGTVGSIDVSWSVPSDDGGTSIENYYIYRSGSSTGEETRVAIVGPGVRTWTDTGRLAGLTQYYRVRAINMVGGSPYSDQVCSKPNPSLAGVC
jgi:subtilisin family serine protease